ncbi:hypothetical protein [Actinopolymorpha alba]|uniref:hypothetical protein n=1 Tax=Actinopolymorpha alba TaxID=533267 RepID=UPI0003807B6B|nr:hypothetical protein [Actinopolymorpha alba]
MPATHRSSPPASTHAELANLFAVAVWRLRRRTRRRLFAATAHVILLRADGAPTRPPSDDLLATTTMRPDHALRVDLAVGALDRELASARPVKEASGGPVKEASGEGGSHFAATLAALLVVRPGPMEPSDEDFGWWRAWLVACDIVGVSAGPAYIATRIGWFDLNGPGHVIVPRLRARRNGL